MAKAEFNGTCQDCGHFQKLPNGRMSLHGYAVQWSQFVGTCPGSRELPYERSCERIKARIVDALASAENLETQATEWESGTLTQVPVNVWFPSVGSTRGYYAWRIFDRDEITISIYQMATYVHPTTGKKERLNTYGTRTELELITKQQDAYAQTLRVDADDMRRYAAWQQERVNRFVPDAPLQPVVEAAVPSDRCVGSGTYARQWSARYEHCDSCGRVTSVSNGKLRSHKVPTA